MLGEHIHSRGMVGTVTNIKSLHLRHQVQEEVADSLLAFWKPTKKKTQSAVNYTENRHKYNE